MKIPKIRSASDFRAKLFDALKEVEDGETQLVTHKAGPGVIVISQEKLNALIEENETLKAISHGLADIEAGRTVPHDEAKKRIKEMRAKWAKRK